MEFLKFLIKFFIMLSMVFLIVLPFLLEYFTFRRDKDKKISFKRFRMVVYTAVYIIVITFALYLFKELFLWMETLSIVKWLVAKIALSSKTTYCGRVIASILVNFAIGMLYFFLSKLVRIGLKNKNIVDPKNKSGRYSLKQKAERKIIKFFYKESWFFVANIFRYLNSTLSILYSIIFLIYQIPAMFSATWIKYDFISTLFSAGYIYPTITLLGLWEIYYFLEGIKRLEEECPELIDDKKELKNSQVDLHAIDEEIHKQFENYYVCDVELSNIVPEEDVVFKHNDITELISQSVENDARNPQKRCETYLNCLDKIVGNDKGLLINGNFFSGFSMYFLRYLSAIVARGDNLIFVCNSDTQIEEVYDYLNQGFSEISSLYYDDLEKESVNLDEPIWRIAKVSGEYSVIEENIVDDCNILVTSLGYLCSSRFENEHSKFITLVDDVIFVDTLNTVNTFNRQLAILNTRLKHIVKKNANRVKNIDSKNIKNVYRLRYISRKIRYICFDDTRTPGLDKVLKNMLAVDFDSADTMNYNANSLVRCYSFEGKPNEDGKFEKLQFINAEEDVGIIMNMAILSLAKGATNVTVFAEDIIPYANIAESLDANAGQLAIKVDKKKIQINKCCYNPNNYSVIIAVDSGNNLPVTMRRYLAMASNKPTLVIVISRRYMLRDFYFSNLNRLWISNQIERIPVEEGTKKDVAQKILVRANAGGISKADILRLASVVPQYGNYVADEDTTSILFDVLKVYGENIREKSKLFDYFEYSFSHDFDEAGKYMCEERIVLRRSGEFFNRINGRDMVVMVLGEKEIILPIPRSKMTQNYIEGQNLLYNGLVYRILRIDTAKGRIYTKLTVGGKNNEPYQYIQARNYQIEINPEQLDWVFTTKHVSLDKKKDNISVSDAYVSVVRVPMQVTTSGYYTINPNTLSLNCYDDQFHRIDGEGQEELAKQTYRRYGTVSTPIYSSDSIIEATQLNASEKGALIMSIRFSGQFGTDINKTMALAATMLNDIIHSMFPSAADAVVVCPVLHGDFSADDATQALKSQPKLTVVGESSIITNSDFELVIIEDCCTDLGVVSVLMSSGDDILNTLFTPIYNYLKWYSDSIEKNNYLYYGLNHEPSCFDFDSLYKVSELLVDSKYTMNFVDIDTIVEYKTCDFCGKRYAKDEELTELNDGRKMCKECADSLVANDKKALKMHFEHAKIFLESTYGITLNGDCDVCFDTTINIVNTLKQNRKNSDRHIGIPLKSYIDDKMRIHVEYNVPTANLSELLVRELTNVWQKKHLPDIAEDLTEGLLSLVAIQYLRFLSFSSLASVRTSYYECCKNIAGEGYRKLVHELLVNSKYCHNPFKYLLDISGNGGEEESGIIQSVPIQIGNYGLPYTPEKPDRSLDGNITYFYYNRLTETQQKGYNMFFDAVKNHAETITIEGFDFDTFCKINYAVMYDHPELFWYKSFSASGSTLYFKYGASAEEAAVLQKQIDDVVEKYISDIDDSMSAYDVAIRMHERIISAVDYDTIALNKEKTECNTEDDKIDYLRTICGVFLDCKAVCEGYARAFQYLIQKCGVECAEVVGNVIKENGDSGVPHAWNILKIDGDYYYVDSTWDDSSNTVQTVRRQEIGYAYFNITSDEMLKTRDLSLCPTEIPVCAATKANYYYHNNYVVDKYDIDRIKEIAQIAAKNNSPSFSFKCKTKAVYTETMNNLFIVGNDCYSVLKAATKSNKSIATNKYTYIPRQEFGIVTVIFNTK